MSSSDSSFAKLKATFLPYSDGFLVPTIAKEFLFNNSVSPSAYSFVGGFFIFLRFWG